MTAIRSADYTDTVKALTEDPAIRELAHETCQHMLGGFNPRHTDGRIRYEFMTWAGREFRTRGGTAPKDGMHIGAPAEAILAVLATLTA